MANITPNVLQIKEIPTHRKQEKSLISPYSHRCAELFSSNIQMHFFKKLSEMEAVNCKSYRQW